MSCKSWSVASRNETVLGSELPLPRAKRYRFCSKLLCATCDDSASGNKLTHNVNPRTHAMLRATYDAYVMLGVLNFKATSTAVGDAGESFNDRRCRKCGESLDSVPAMIE